EEDSIRNPLVTGVQTCALPISGNKLFHGYGNIESNPKAGLVFFIPGHNSTVRVNGKVRVIDKSELPHVHLEVHNPDEKAEILQGDRKSVVKGERRRYGVIGSDT